jgi:hypothetical protein
LPTADETFERPHRHTGQCLKLAGKRPLADLRSDLRLLGHLERIVDFDTEVPHGALKFGMA